MQKIMKSYQIFGIVFFALLCACRQPDKAQEETKGKTEHIEEHSTVFLSAAQIKMAGIEMGPIEMKNLTASLSVTGTLAVPSQNKAFVTSLVNGTLRNLFVQPGDDVRKGQAIGTIANTELSAIQQQLIAVTAQVKFASQEVARQRELVAGNAAPLKNLQRAETEWQALQVQQEALKRQLEVLGVSARNPIAATLTITAPVSGTISEIDAQIGSPINASSPIAQIINNSELHLDLFVYEKDLLKVAVGQTIHFTLTNNPGKEYDAIIYSIGTAFVNETKAVPVHARVINDKSGLIEGMGVTARISIGEGIYPAVPDAALANDGGNDYIFLVDKEVHAHTNETNHDESNEEQGMRFKRVQVIKGTSDVGYTEIKPIVELDPKAKIVTKGSFFLMAKMTNSGEHEHG